MTSRISPEDWEILSAYLDGQVSAKEREKLKQKLETEPELQHALEDLQRTKMVLRSAPRRRVPHNFTLSPSMIPQRKPFFRLVPTLSFASAMAVILLVLTFTFTGLAGFSRPGSLAAQAPAPTQAAARSNLAVPQADQTQPAVANPPIVNWGGGGFGGGGGGGGGAGGSGQATGIGGGEAPTETLPPEVIPPGKGAEIGATPTPETGIGGGKPLNPALTLTPETTPETSIVSLPTETAVAPTVPPAPEAAPLEGTGPILGIRPTQEMGKIVVDQGNDQFTARPAATTVPAAPPSFVSQYLVAIQIGLGVIALLMAVAAFLLHRRS